MDDKARIQELLEANNRYLQRAREAEKLLTITKETAWFQGLFYGMTLNNWKEISNLSPEEVQKWFQKIHKQQHIAEAGLLSNLG